MPRKSACYTFDVRGLLAWSHASANEFAIPAADIESGQVRIFSCAWNEMHAVYEDEAKVFEDLDFKREPLSEEHRESVVAIADTAKATFGWKGTYDKAVEWQIAGVATCEGLIVVTDERGKKKYSKIDGIKAVTFAEYIEDHD
ncbi:hypothetical protein [Bradyrhizobium sp. Bra78]|uniref:hypothetical protein n=1 Tax=Bradyrhizobium sp. Bra78 TaxID=2926010 RepID=UPI0021C7987B|nr:hypothetical protein [Bradyrhizobium sp. Bra78]